MIFSCATLAAVLGPVPSIAPLPSAGPDIRSIVPPQPYYVSPGWYWLAIVTGVLVLVALILWWLVREKTKPAGPVLTPRELAVRQLKELEARMDDLDARGFGAAVADVLRVYIGAQYGLHPERQTSEEFLSSITGSREFSVVEHALLREFLGGCDLLKFARADATSGNKHRLLRQAGDFLEDSAQPPPSTTGASATPQSLTLGA